MIIAGIDYSMTSPAICVYDTSKPLEFHNLKFFNLNDKKKVQGCRNNIQIKPIPVFYNPMDRYDKLSNWAMDILLSENVESVQIEGYAMGSSSGLVFNIAENTGLLKHKMYKAGINFECPSPGNVKKTFTGKGNAKKPDMCDEFHKRFGVRISDIVGCKQADSPDNDMVDAFANMLTHPAMEKHR